MLRRVHLAKLSTGSIVLPPDEAHHIRDVLRFEVGSPLELFDDAGQVATGVIRHLNVANVVVDVETIQQAGSTGAEVIVASAVPKGDRADWMVEKLTELGVARFIPLVTERSVVLPAGKNKIQRWERIAIESAKQSRRAGVMAISPLTPLDAAIAATTTGIFLSTSPDAACIAAIQKGQNPLTLFIGPEGGWTDGEVMRMKSAGFTAAGLTATILRVETAGVIAAGIAICQSGSPGGTSGAP